jgi:heavy metal sensor kinase
MKLFLSIKTRLTLWYLLIIAVILIFFSLFTYFMLSGSLYDIARGTSELTVLEPVTTPANNSQSELSAKPVLISTYLLSAEWLEQIKTKSASTLSIYTPRGQLIIDQKNFISAEMHGEQQVQLFLLQSANTPEATEFLAVVQPVSEVKDTLAAYTRVLYFVIPITAVLAAGCGFLLIWRMLKPVNAMIKTAQDIQEKDLSRRIEVQSNDELGRLAATLNQTFERLQQAFKRERQFTSDASHELRTPLSIMQSEATLALKKERSNDEYRNSLVSLSQETSHMSSIINKLLVLSRIDSGKENISYSNINFSELLAELALDIDVLCEDKSIHFSSDLNGGVYINGDSVKLRELFLNLLDNAVKFTPSGGKITLSLKNNSVQAVVSVSDTGIGINQEHLPHIFERFYRVEKNSTVENQGAGLGLAICKHIVELHQGQIQVESTPGNGSIFTVTLPLAST